ncbi:hypothetical protein ACOMHN_065247 [Nucella lapillus]
MNGGMWRSPTGAPPSPMLSRLAEGKGLGSGCLPDQASIPIRHVVTYCHQPHSSRLRGCGCYCAIIDVYLWLRNE